MSFYSSLKYYRPRKPPIVTANDLASVVSQFAETGKLTAKGMFGLKIKFGDSIDSDDLEDSVPTLL